MNTCGNCGRLNTDGFTNCARCRHLSRRWKRKNWLRNMLFVHKSNDRRKGIYDPDNFCDVDFLKSLLTQQKGFCFHCTIPLDFPERNSKNGLSIQRLDNSIGHTKQNCVLACKSCNNHRVEGETEKSNQYLVKRLLEAEWEHLKLAGYQCLGNSRSSAIIS